MKEGSTFIKVSLMFLRKIVFKNFGGGGENRKEPFLGKITLKNFGCGGGSQKRANNFFAAHIFV